jgi:diguanylate cyclase (GGDEF)-like protein
MTRMVRAAPTPRRTVRPRPTGEAEPLRQLEVLHEISLELLQNRDVKTLTEQVLTAAIELVGGNGGGLYLRRDDGWLELMAAINPMLSQVGAVIAPGDGASGWVMEHKEPLLLNDYLSWPNHSARFRDRPNRSLLCVPLVVDAQARGVLIVSCEGRTDAFTHNHLRTLERLAALVAVALENARLFEALNQSRSEAESRSRSLEVLNQMTLQLMRSRGPEHLIDQVLESAREMVGAQTCMFWQVTPDGANLEVVRVTDDALNLIGGRSRLGEGLVGRVAGNGQAMLVNDYGQWKHRNPRFERYTQSIAAAPIGRGKPFLGVLTLLNVPGGFKQTDLDLLGRLAVLVTVSLENAHLYEVTRRAEAQTRRRAELLEALHETSLEMTAQLEPERLLYAILERALALLGGDAGVVYLRDDADTIRLGAAIGTDMRSQLKLGQGVSGRVVKTGKPMLVSDYQTYQSRVRSAKSTWRSVASAPLRRGETILGVLSVADTRGPDRFSPDDLNVLERLAALAGIALENARLYESERRSARDERLRAQVSAAVARLRSVSQLCAAVMKELSLVLGYRYVTIFLMQDGELHLQSQVGYDTPPLVMNLETGINGRVARTAQAVLIENGREDPDFLAVSEELQSQVCAPLMGRDGVLGTISVESDGNPALGSQDLEMLTAVAATVSVALENALLHEDAKRRAAELDWLKREAEYAARHDALTGLPNRRAFEADILAAFKRSQLLNQPFTLGAIDLVGFKAVNDHFGHDTGDTALRRVAAELMASKVAAYRVGGDEFALLIHADHARALETARQIVKAISAIDVGHDLRVALNIGLAEYPTDASDLDRLQSLADNHMYLAKRAGRAVLERHELDTPPAARRRESDH